MMGGVGTTLHGVFRRRLHIILGLVLGMAGCTAAPGRPPAPATAVSPAARPVLEESVRAELGDAATADLPSPALPEPPPTSAPSTALPPSPDAVRLGLAPAGPIPFGPADPGAAALAGALARRVGGPNGEPDGPATRSGPVRIALGRVRNRAHPGPREFEAFLDRFAGALTGAGEPNGIVVVAGADAEAAWALTGTAYLVTDRGFEQWELFLRLRARDASAEWRIEPAVRVLRFPAVGQPQVLWSEPPPRR